MQEPSSNTQIRDKNQRKRNYKQQSFTLPSIQRRRGNEQLRSSSELDRKQQLTLVNINKNKKMAEQGLTKTDDTENTFIGLQIMKQKNKNVFAKEVKQKLHLVLGQIPQDYDRLNEQQYSEDSDFEAKINKNKQLIKQHRLNKGSQNEIRSTQIPKKNKDASSKKLEKAKNQLLYQKRVKQYRDQSTENKYLQKRKQVIVEKQKEKEKLINFIKQNYNQQHKSANNSPIISPRQGNKAKDQYNSIKNDKNYNDKNVKAQNNKSKNKNQRSISFKQPAKSLNNVSKTVTLFDGIQSYLQNPRDNSKQMNKHLVGLTLLKAKRDIEDKIKNINQKIGVVEIQKAEKKIQIKSLDMGATVRNWQRVEIIGDQVNCHNSNFDKQLERINDLQERNSICLQRFLEHQQILLELEQRRRQLPRSLHTNSH